MVRNQTLKAVRHSQVTLTKVLLIVSVMLLLTQLTGTVLAQGFAKGYATNDTALRPGMAVSLSADGTAEKPLVERSTTELIDKVIGVATTPEENLVNIGAAGQTVYLQASGVVAAFVSDINGTVNKGDGVTVSPLKGILMRADSSSPHIGTAMEDFPAAMAEQQTVETSTGPKEVKVARFNISLDSALAGRQQELAEEETALQRLGRSITGKEVGELQVIIALIIFLVVMVAEGSIIYGAVTSAITSLGRNPLAKNIIVKELLRVLGLTIIVLLVGLGAIYAVLNI